MLTQFTPYAGLIGGALIGLSAVILMAGNGRLAGCSGIFRGILGISNDGDAMWRWLFWGGLIAGAFLARTFAANAETIALPSLVPSILGGLLVGLGTTIGNGCTSGHGICGMSRFSIRSTAAVATFMAVAIVTAYVFNHLLAF